MSHDPVDLGPLDPALDQVRWERLVRSVAARGAAGAALRRPRNLVLQLAAWARPAMALAAAAALVAWAPTLLRRGVPGTSRPSTASARSTPPGDPAARLAAWADDTTSGGDALVLALGVSDDAR
jgi:hypothetical protein